MEKTGFTAEEAKRQAKRIQEQLAIFTIVSANISSACSEIANKVESEDNNNNLAITLRNMSTLYEEMQKKITDKFNSLAGAMTTWAEATSVNEGNASAQTSSINERY